MVCYFETNYLILICKFKEIYVKFECQMKNLVDINVLVILNARA